MQSVSADKLKKLCKEYYHIHTDNDERAVAILQERLNASSYDVEEDGSIRLYEQMDNLVNVSKALYEGGVVPITLNINEANLEKYYMDMVGEQNVEHNEGTELSN